MNFPTSDIQFVAGIVRKLTIAIPNALSVDEAHRLEEIAEKGFSSPVDAPDPVSGG